MFHGPPLSNFTDLNTFCFLKKSRWKDAGRYDRISKMGGVCPGAKFAFRGTFELPRNVSCNGENVKN